MAKLPPIRRLTREDFKSELSWIDTLLYPLNLFITGITSALNNQLTLKENMLAQVNTILVTTKAVVAPAAFPWATSYDHALASVAPLQTEVSYSTNFTQNPIAVLVAKVSENVGNPRVSPYGVYADWVYDSGMITINQVSGLQPSTQYYVTLLTYFG